jgi:Spy/CpxP family protein refolding chaperone
MSIAIGSKRTLRMLAATLFAVAASAASPALATAQRGGGGAGSGGGRGRMVTALFEGITLADAQQKSVDSIRAVYQPQMEQLRGQGPGSRPQMRDLMQKQTADLRSVLTADQQATFDKNRDAMRARMSQGGGTGGGGNPQ